MQKQSRPAAQRLWGRVLKTPTCWLWTGATSSNGYGNIWDNAGQHTVRVHRLSWEIHFGTIPDGLLVCHHCDVRNCVRPDHLFLGTKSANAIDMLRKGRGPHDVAPGAFAQLRGENIHLAKLTSAEVVRIREQSVAGQTGLALAAEFGVANSTIYAILRRETWRHI